MHFSQDELAGIRALLQPPVGSKVIDLMYRLNLGLDVSAVSDEVLKSTGDFGWLDPGAETLSELGAFVSDSCREYTFWLERDRALPFDGVAGLTPDYFAGKSVVEIGCGMGANLMSLGRLVSDLCGVEPLDIYAQMGAILREREGLPAVDIRSGSGEDIPFPEDRFDVVLCVSAHQYMDICPALAEMVRVLRPGGELIIIGGMLGRYLKDAAAEFPAQLKAHVITTVNTLSYMGCRRRMIPSRGAATTSRPIYPLPLAMQRWMRQVGLDVGSSLPRVGTETVYRGIKRG